MLPDRTSQFRPYSLGIVVEDKERNSKEIKVTPIEDLPNLEVPLKDYEVKYEIELPDAQGILRKAKVKGGAIITARWLPINHSNRVTAPDVIKNETVQLYRYSDSEEYFWDTIKHEPNIRRLETVKHAYGDKTAPLEEWDDDSSYWMQVSTHDKKVELHTATSDGEAVKYDTEFEMKKGSFSLQDDQGNSIELQSVGGVWTIKATTMIILDAPEVIVTGNLTVGGTLRVGGGIISASVLTGGLGVTGNISYSGEIANKDPEEFEEGPPVQG